jgi:hypothetical protein
MVIYLVVIMPEALILILSLFTVIQTHNVTFNFSERCGYLIQCGTPIPIFITVHKFLRRRNNDLVHIISIFVMTYLREIL